MENKMVKHMETAISEGRKRSIWLKIVSVLGCTVAVCVICALILPAIAMNRDTVCGLEEHAHTEACYSLQVAEGEVALSCDLEALNVHVHNADCYDTSHAVICGYASYMIHVHNDLCFEAGVQVCTLQQIEEHTHGEDCYGENQQKICGKEEVLPHTHTDGCFANAEDGSKTLTCTQLQVLTHAHTDACFAPKTVRTVICGEQEHTHEAACYPAEETVRIGETISVTKVKSALSEQENVIASGICGNALTWTVTDTDGVMTLNILGEGEMRYGESNYTPYSMPWKSYSDQIEKIYIEEGVTSICPYAFCWMYSLREVVIPASVTTIDAYAFEDDQNLVKITHPVGYWKVTDTAFEDTAFSALKGHLYTDANDVIYKILNDFALVAHKPEGISDSNIPDYVDASGKNYPCAEKETPIDCGSCGTNLIWTVTEPGGIQTLTIFGEGEMYIERYPEYYSSYYNQYEYCQPWENYRYTIEAVCINSGATSIAQYAFSGFSNLTEVTIPGTVKSIDEHAFGGCGSLQEITIPEGVTSIGVDAFTNCGYLEKITIPASVEIIRDTAFANCHNLSKVILGEGYVDIIASAFAKTPFAVLKGTVYADAQGGYYTIAEGKANVVRLPDGVSDAEVPEYIDPAGNNYPVVREEVIIDSGTCGEQVTWTLSELTGKKTLTISGTGPISGSNYYIAPWERYQTEISTVIIEEGLTAIGDYTFYEHTALTEVVMADSVASIGDNAFYGCTVLTEVPDLKNVTDIGGRAFFGCTSLTEVTILNSGTNIDADAFYGCTGLQKVTLPEGYYSFEEDEFMHTSVTHLTGTVYVDDKGIQYVIIDGCAVVAYLPEGIFKTEIPDYIDPTGKNYPVRDEIVIAGGAWGSDLTWELEQKGSCVVLTISGTGRMPDHEHYYEKTPWEQYNDKINTVVIEQGVTSIGSYVFSYCYELTEVSVPESVTSIGYGAFYYCDSLTEITLPSELTSIGEYAFSNCDSLTEITLPSGLTSIGGSAFSNCDSLTEITLPSELTSIGEYAFSNCDSLTEITLPSGLTSIEPYVFYNCDSLTKITLPSSLTSIGEYAFSYCTDLTELTIPEHVTSIEPYAFSYCTDLTEITLPSGLTSIEPYVFDNCGNLTKITLPSGVTSIGEYAFSDCINLAEITLPEGVASIGWHAFNNCASLTEITLPEGITDIDYEAFSDCTKLEKVSIDLSDTTINRKIFSGCTSPIEVVLRDGYGNISAEAFVGTNLSDVSGRVYADANGVIYRILSGKAAVIYQPTTVADADILDYIDPTGENYPVVKEIPVIASGTYVSAFWALIEENGIRTLFLSGAGSIGDLSGQTPWDAYRGTIQRVEIEKGFENICDFAFSGCTALNEVVLPEGYIETWDGFSGTPISYLNGKIYTDSNGVQYKIQDEAAYVLFQPENVTDDMIPDTIDPTGKNYPVNRESNPLESGKIGENGTWSISQNDTGKTLTISGTGYVYCNGSEAPWIYHQPEINTVVIEEGITSIGGQFFSGCTGLETVYLNAERMYGCDSSAFDGCTSLQEIVVGDEVERLYPELFAAARSGKGAVVPVRFVKPNHLTVDSEFGYSSNKDLLGAYSGKLLPGFMHYIGGNDAGQIYLIRRDMAYYVHCDIPSAPEATIPTERNDNSSYPVYRSEDYAQPTPVVTGSDDEIGWLLYEKNDGSYELVVVGFGGIPDYSINGAPWDSYREKISSVKLSDSIPYIGENAFYGCNRVQHIEIPRGVNYVNELAFAGCSELIGFSVAEGNTAYSAHYGILYNADQTELILCPEGKTSAQNIPGTVTTVAEKAFYNNKKLNRLKLPDSVVVIGDRAFAGCSTLQTLTLSGDGLAVGEYAFEGCKGLTSVSILGADAALGKYAFFNCTNLETVNFASAPAGVDDFAFSGCTKIAKIHSPAGYIRMGEAPFGDCNTAYRYATEGLNYVDDEGVFYWIVGDAAYCLTPKEDRPTGYTMPIYTPQIGEQAACKVDAEISAFYAYGTAGELCWYIVKEGDRQTLVIAGQGKMDNYSYYYSSNKAPWSGYRITDLIIKEGVTSVGNDAFYGKSNLERVKIPASVTSIGYGAFEDCSDLISVTIEKGYTNIASDSFVDTPMEYLSGKIYTDANGVHYQIQGEMAFVVFRPANVTEDRIPDHIDPEGENYPVVKEDEIHESGTEGSIQWKYVELDGVRTLIFSGTGKIPDYYPVNPPYHYAPWHWCVADQVIIEKGITAIGYSSYLGNPSVLVLPEGYILMRKGTFGPPYDVLHGTVYTDANGVSYRIIDDQAHVVLRPEHVTDDMIPDVIDSDNNCYPVIKDSAVIDDGKCGDDLTWKLVESQGKQKLIISGTGEMYDFETNYYSKEGRAVPWKPYMDMIDSVTIENGATSIGNYAFHNCTDLTEAVLPDSLTSIGECAFNNCTGLTEVTIPDSVTRIGDDAFYYCAGLTEVVIPDSVISIGDRAFYYCTGLTEIEILASQISIGEYTFYNCTGLSKVTLAEGYTTIAPNAFKDTPVEYLSGTIYTDSNGVQYQIQNGVAYVVFQPEYVTDDMIPDYIDPTGKNYPVNKDGIPLGYGKCGDNLFWQVVENDDGAVLTIFGTGPMYDFWSGSIPWGQYAEKIHTVLIEDGATSIGEYAFYKCNQLKEFTIPDSVTSIGECAFAYCTQLTEVTIPENVTVIGDEAFYRCYSLNKVTLNAKDLASCSSYAFYECRAIKEVVIGTGVDNLNDSLLDAIRDNSTDNRIHFQGPNHFTVSSVSYDWDKPLSLMKAGESYFVDEMGAMYRVADGEAVLIYVPAGLTDLVVPKSIPTADGSEEMIPVIGVGSNALVEAKDLTKLSFEDPGAVTQLADYAMANCPTLETVNGKTVIEEAIATFSNATTVGVDILENTGLRKALNVMVENFKLAEETIVIQGNQIQLNINPPARTELYTGEVSRIIIGLDTPHKEEEGDSDETTDDDTASLPDSVRVYFHFSAANGTFGLQEYTDKGKYKVEGIEIGVGKENDSDVYYMDFPTSTGKTLQVPVENIFPAPGEGGTLTVWAEWTDVRTDESIRTDCHRVHWRTVPDDFKVTKELASTPRVYADGTEEGINTIHDLSYVITMQAGNVRDLGSGVDGNVQNIGLDYMTRAEFTDVLTLPEEMRWKDGVIDAIREGKWYFSNGDDFIVIVEGISETLFSMSYYDTKEEKLWITDDNQIAIGWTYDNPYTNREMPARSFTLDVADEMIICDTGDSVILEAKYSLRNDITVTQHFSHSGVQVDEVRCAHDISANKAAMALKKIPSNQNGRAYYGESYEYTVEMKNYYAQHIETVDTIYDELSANLYITAEDIYRMFCYAPEAELEGKTLGDYLTITINGATIYHKQTLGNVMGSKGNIFALTYQNTSGIGTQYYGTETADVEGHIECLDNAVIQFRKTEEGVAVVLDKDQMDSQEGSLVGIAASGEELGNILNDMGYYVTPFCRYTVEWNFNGELPLWSGQTRTIRILSSLKDAFMQIGQDYPHCPLHDPEKNCNRGEHLEANGVRVHYRTVLPKDAPAETILGEASLPKDTQTAHAYTSSCSVYSDFALNVDYEMNGRKVEMNSTIKGGGLVDLVYTVKHSGQDYHNIVPLVGKMYGAQVLLVRVSDNPHLAEGYGLVAQTVGGIDYFTLDKAGTYPRVNVGGYIADHVTVSMRENELNSVMTTVHWYLEGIYGSTSTTVPMKVLLTTNAAPATEIIYRVDAEGWLNDHQSHRLWVDRGIYWSFVEAEKKIVLEHTPNTEKNDVLDSDDYTVIREGESVTYRLKLSAEIHQTNVQAGRTETISGSIFHDILPPNPISSKDNEAIDWQIGKLEYVYDKNKVTIVNEDAYQLTRKDPLTGKTSGNQQYIVWSDLFTITFRQTADVYIYVTLTYPSGDDWERYCTDHGDELIENSLYFSTEKKTVQHALYRPASALLVKGVNSTGIWKENGRYGTYYPSNEYSSRFLYSNNDGMKRVVTYYIALYNDGDTRLYLNEIQDKLPKGFTFRENSIAVATTSSSIASVDDENNQVVYRKANVNVVESQNGKLCFAASGGDLQYDGRFSRYYLLPNEALVFSYQCFTGNEGQTDSQSMNCVAMPHFQYNLCGVEMGDSKITGTKLYSTQKNDGTCEIINAGTASLLGFKDDPGEHSTQWLTSKVNVETGKIAPGIIKQIKSVQNSLTQNEIKNPTHASLEDRVNWDITAVNTGTEPIRNYVLTDMMQQEYIFDSDINYVIHYGDHYSTDLKIEGKLISIADLVKKENGNDQNGYTVSFGVTPYTSPHPIFGKLKVTYTPCTPTRPSVLSIEFADDKAAIPEGGSAVLSVTTRMQPEGNRRNTTYTNTGYLIPSQSWTETDVTMGEQVNLQGKPAVRSSDQITVASHFVTDSYKAVTEIKTPDSENTAVNTAVSKKNPEAIVLDKRTNLFTYELTVSNIGTDIDEMKEYTIIDTLPGLHDHNILLEDNPRFSEFRVILAEEPNFTVEVLRSDGTVVNPAYTVQYTTATSFTEEDWSLDSTGSVTWLDTLTEENRDRIRSFRIVLDEGEVIESGCSITVKFDARILSDDLSNGNAIPGAVAWNSFAYRYWFDSANTYLSAEPLKVGVKIPSAPQLVKELRTPDGREWNAEQDETFSYVIYRQEDTVELPDFDGLTEEEIGAALQTGGVEFTRVSLTVSEGSSRSECLMLQNQKHWSYEEGIWTEGAEIWEWNHNSAYVFYELPISNQEDYAFGAMEDVRENGFRYLYDRGEKMTVISMNLRKVWNINLLKISDNSQSTPLENAWFGLYSPEMPREDVAIPEGLTETVAPTLTYEDEEGAVQTHYLCDIAVSDSEGMIRWKDLRLQQYLIQELQAPVGHDYDDTVHVITRPKDIRFNTYDMSIVNRSGFEMPESGGVGNIPIPLAGILLTVLAGTMLFMKKRRKNSAQA